MTRQLERTLMMAGNDLNELSSKPRRVTIKALFKVCGKTEVDKDSALGNGSARKEKQVAVKRRSRFVRAYV